MGARGCPRASAPLGEFPLLHQSRLPQRLAAVDGAILMDPRGFCHAFAVILDGIASATGDPSRGARYNSSIRYRDSREGPTAIVIVSEDGGVDIEIGGVR